MLFHAKRSTLGLCSQPNCPGEYLSGGHDQSSLHRGHERQNLVAVERRAWTFHRTHTHTFVILA